MATKLKNIRVNWFRGAKDTLELDLQKGRSIGVYGDNGGGKSTITDSIEWFYRDRIDHLWREDCKEECLRNTQCLATQNAIVSLEFNNEKFNSEKKLSPSFRSSNSNKSKEFKVYIEQSKKERLFLRYQDILRFILLTKGKKRNELMNIIGYRAITEIRDVLVRIANDIQKNQRFIQLKGQLEKNEKELIKKFGSFIKTKEELYKKANELIKPLKIGETISDPDSYQKCLDKIEVKTDKNKQKKYTKLSNYKTALNTVKEQLQDITDYDDFLLAYRELLKDKAKMGKIGLNELLEKGQKAIADSIVDENICPLCLSKIESSKVITRIRERINELEEIREDVDEAESKRTAAVTNLNSIMRALDNAQRNEIEDDPDFKSITAIVSVIKDGVNNALKDLKQNFKKLKIIEKDPNLFETKFESYLKEIEAVVPKIEEKIDSLSETEKQKQQFEVYSNLKDLKRLYDDNVELLIELIVYDRQISSITKIKDEFIQTQATALVKVMNAISSDVDTFYKIINPEEGIENFKLDILGDEGVEFSYSFHGKEVHPPIKYLSEAHLNCVGICLFLASVRIFNKENKFFILDDVIASFDANHRIPLLRLLKDYFSDYQVMLFTHERYWFEMIGTEMRPLGWLLNDVSWSIDDGVELGTSVIGIREKIERKVDGENFDVANDLRKLLEHILKETCLCLEVRVRFLRDGENERRMPGELLSGLRSKLKKNRSDIKDAPILNSIATSALVTSRESHDSSDFTSKGDIKQIRKDIDELEGLFLCPDCGKYVSLRFKDEAGKEVKCKCGNKKIAWAFA